MIAYPELCRIDCTGPGCNDMSAEKIEECGVEDCAVSNEMLVNRELLKPWTRHLGGSNIGFMDGSARWMMAQQILAESPRFACGCRGGGLVYRKLKGIEPLGPTSAAGSPANGVPEGATPSTLECGLIPLY